MKTWTAEDVEALQKDPFIDTYWAVKLYIYWPQWRNKCPSAVAYHLNDGLGADWVGE